MGIEKRLGNKINAKKIQARLRDLRIHKIQADQEVNQEVKAMDNPV